MKRPALILVAFLSLSCNHAYKFVTGFRNPKTQRSTDIISFAENHRLTEGMQYMVNNEDYLKNFQAISFVSSNTYFLLFDSLGNFTRITPDNSNAHTLERVKLSELPVYYRKFEIQSALIDSLHRVAWFNYYHTLHIDSVLKRAIAINKKSDSQYLQNKPKKDFTVIIPWAIFMGKKDQLKTINNYLSAIKKNQHSAFDIIFINYDPRKECKNGEMFVKNFKLTLQD